MDLIGDSPQDAAWALVRALRSTAEDVGASFSYQEERSGVGVSITVDMQKDGRELRSVITYVHEVQLGGASGTIGNGFIGDFGEIELMYDGFPEEIKGPPYHWGMWPFGTHYLSALSQGREVNTDLVRQAVERNLVPN